MSKMAQHPHKVIIQGVILAATLLLAPQLASGKTLFLAHYDETLDADFALGIAAARPLKGYQRAGIVTAGHWGGALDLTDSNRTCTYPALKNLDPRRGTVAGDGRVEVKEVDHLQAVGDLSTPGLEQRASQTMRHGLESKSPG